MKIYAPNLITDSSNVIVITGSLFTTNFLSASLGVFKSVTGSISGSNAIFSNLNVTQGITGNLTGSITGDVLGNVVGDVTGSISGSSATLLTLSGDLTGDVLGNVVGDVTGSVSGSTATFDTLSGDLTGDVLGNVVGDVTGSISGSIGKFNLVGIGSNSPSNTLDVKGNTLLDGNLTVTGQSLFLSASYINITSSVVTIGDNILTLNAYSPFKRYAGIEMHDSGSSALAQFLWDSENNYFFVSGSTATNSQNLLILGPDNNSSLTAGALPVSYNGNELSSSIVYQKGDFVGIGVVSPSYKLDINDGSIFLDSDWPLYLGSTNAFIEGNSSGTIVRINGSAGFKVTDGGDTRFLIDTNGNVGIGGSPTTVTHGPHLDIVGNRGTLTVGTGYFEDNGTTNFLNGARPLAFGYAGSEKMRINFTGNVGIGTSSPNAKLEVSGSSNSSLLNIKSSVGDELLSVSGSGEIKLSQYGLGTFTGTPTYKLSVDVNGNIIETSIGAGQVDGSGITNYISKWTDSNTLATSSLYDDGTNVGIGTTSPEAKLYVLGADASVAPDTTADIAAFEFSAGAGVDGVSLLFPDDKAGQLVFGTPSDNLAGRIVYTGPSVATAANQDSMRFYTSGSQQAIINKDGNVGIGITSPSAKLDIVSPNDSNAIFVRNSSNLSRLTHNIFIDSSNYGKVAIYDNAQNTKIFLNTNGNSYFNGGNVGIGTTSPSHNLHVDGLTKLGEAGKTEGGAVINYASFGEVKSGAQTLLGNAVVPGTTDNTIQHSKSDAGNFMRMVYSKGISFHTNITSSLNTDVNIDTNERMRIDTSGNVGIGTASPSEKLHVSGYLLVDSGLHFRALASSGLQCIGFNRNTGNGNIYDSNYYAYQINNSANIFELQQYSGSGTFLTHPFRATTTELVVNDSGTNYDFRVEGDNDVNLLVCDASTDRVGIGNTSPDYKLDVAGDIRISNSNIFRLFTSGNVERGSIQATDTDHLIIATSGGEHIRFKDGGVSGTTNMSILGNGQIVFNNYGSGSFTGTATQKLAVDSSGNVIETEQEKSLSTTGGTIDTGFTADQFTMLEVIGYVNPNSAGSVNYKDPVHIFVYNGVGWNGSVVTNYIYSSQMAPLAREIYSSGSSASGNEIEAVFLTGSTESDDCPNSSASSYQVRLKISNYNQAGTSGFTVKVIKKY